jgi:hypothetical protein
MKLKCPLQSGEDPHTVVLLALKVARAFSRDTHVNILK